MNKERNREVDISRNTMERRESIKRERERDHYLKLAGTPCCSMQKWGRFKKFLSKPTRHKS
jgi:hypothetical protein